MTFKRPLALYGASLGEITTGDQIHPLVLGSGTRTGSNYLRDDGAWSPAISSFSFVSANGINGVVANPLTAPTLTLSLGDITPSSVTAGAFSSTVSLSTPAVKITQQGSGNAIEVYGPALLSGKLSVNGPILVSTNTDNGVDKVQINGSMTATGVANLQAGATIGTTSLYSSYGTVLSTTTTPIDAFSTVLYRSAKYQIQISDGWSFETLEVFVIHDGVNVYLTSYGNVFTSPQSLGYFDASMATNSISLTYTATTATNKTIRFLRTAIPI